MPEPRPQRSGRRGSHASASRSRRIRGILGTLFRAPPGATSAHLVDRLQRLDNELHTSKAQAARWQRHADAYALERESMARERAHLLAWLAALHPSSAVVAQAPTPNGLMNGWHVLSLVAGGRPLSWDLAPREVPLFQHVRRSADTDTRAWRDVSEIEAQYAHIHRHTRMLGLEDDMARVVEELRRGD